MEQPLIEVIGRQKHVAITWLLTREKVAAAAHPTAYATACGSKVPRAKGIRQSEWRISPLVSPRLSLGAVSEVELALGALSDSRMGSFRASTKSTRLFPHDKVAGLDRGRRAVYTSGAKR